MNAPTTTITLGALGLDRGGHVLIKHALLSATPGTVVEVVGDDKHLAAHLGAWCREQGHAFSSQAGHLFVTRGERAHGRWRGAERSGHHDPAKEDAIVEHPPPQWGLAARGSAVEIGSPKFDFDIDYRF